MKSKAFKGIMLLVAAMIFSAGGTCFAQETVIIDTGSSGTTRVFYGPVFSTVPGSGASAYGVIGDPFGVQDFGAATPFAIARTITDAAGNMNLVWAADALAPHFSGSTPTGSPAVISGETNAFVVAVQAFDSGGNQVADFDGPNNATGLRNTGVTVVMMDGGTMTANWKRGIPETFQGAPAPGYTPYNQALPYYPTELTVWTPRKALDATGATIYGTSTSFGLILGPTGASVWSLTNWGAPAGGGTWAAGSGMTVWPPVPFPTSYSLTGSNTNIFVGGTGNGSVAYISGFVASPVISGNSVFYVGHDATMAGGGGITVYQLHKDHLDNGVIYAATVRPANADFSDRFMPTPVASGGSLFVVCNQGGVTVYDTQDLAIGGGRTAGYIGNILLPQGATNTGVTASPVVYETGQRDPYIIMAGTSAVTCYKISDGLASNQRQWWYDFAANIGVNSTIVGTPAVAADHVYVPVTDSVTGDGVIYAFDITAAPDMANGQLRFSDQFNLNSGAVASPIVVNQELWAFSHGLAPTSSAQAMKWDVRNLMDDDELLAQPYWTQYKFDAAKTGDATLVDDDDDFYDDDTGCFLSTIQ